MRVLTAAGGVGAATSRITSHPCMALTPQHDPPRSLNPCSAGENKPPLPTSPISGVSGQGWLRTVCRQETQSADSDLYLKRLPQLTPYAARRGFQILCSCLVGEAICRSRTTADTRRSLNPPGECDISTAHATLPGLAMCTFLLYVTRTQATRDAARSLTEWLPFCPSLPEPVRAHHLRYAA